MAVSPVVAVVEGGARGSVLLIFFALWSPFVRALVCLYGFIFFLLKLVVFIRAGGVCSEITYLKLNVRRKQERRSAGTRIL